jgi:dipeptidyl aminopeptidase/acylaminoacyl peptidase
MLKHFGQRLALASALLCAAAQAAPQLPTRAFFEDPQYRSVRISPDGKRLAVVMPNAEGRELIAFIDLADRKVTGSARFTGSHTVVWNYRWVSDTRVVIETARKFFGLDEAVPNGELYGVDYDGGQFKMLTGPGARSNLESVRMTQRDTVVFSELLHTPFEGSTETIIQTWNAIRWAFPIARRLDVNTGRTVQLIKGPVQGGSLYTDRNGEIRFADGLNEERNRRKVMYRSPEAPDWRDLGPVLDTLGDRDEVKVLGVAEDGQSIYVTGEAQDSRDLYRIGIDGSSPRLLSHRDGLDVGTMEWSQDRTKIVAVNYAPGRFERVYIEPDDPRARLLRMLDSAFSGQTVHITSTSRGGALAVVHVGSDVNSGDFYLFDTRTKKAEYLFSAHEQLDPELLAPVEPVTIKARDGLVMHAYLTRPLGRSGPAPMVVLVHGGPHGIRDHWAFDPEAQFLANRGYAVLQVNYRGSGGYGKRFETAGYRRWGAEMQDDLTDATRWAVAQGHADPQRICIAGASYGGYAALMGVAREPDLYKCAFGYVGVYDLPLMYGQGDIPESDWGRNFLEKVLGTDDADLRNRSPVYQAHRIKAAVFLAHGGLDYRAHPEHFHRLKRALDKAGKPYEEMWRQGEGHGFRNVENKVALYDQLAAFLAKHIGT